MSIFKVLLKTARKVGPAAFFAVVRYGPKLRSLIQENPQLAEKLSGRFQQISRSSRGDSAEDLNERVAVLKEQVTYLYASTDTSDMARQAAAWRNELEAIQQIIPVIESMSKKAQVIERRKIVMKLDAIASHILAASLENIIEEAEISDDASHKGEEASPKEDEQKQEEA